jgi:hypothetical protein
MAKVLLQKSRNSRVWVDDLEIEQYGNTASHLPKKQYRWLWQD